MVLPVNTMTSGEALSLATQASQRSAQTFQTNLDSLQKMREAREWSSQAQRDMRRAQADAATSEAKAQKLQMDIINENPDLVRAAYSSGQMAKISENFKTKSDNDLDSLALYFGDAKSAEDIEGGIKAALADGRADLVAKIPPIEAMKQDPTLVAQFRLQTSAALRERAFRQKESLTNLEGDIRSRQIQEQGGVESRLIGQRGSVQMGLQQQAQGFQREMSGVEFGQKKDLMGLQHQYDLELQSLKDQNDLEIQRMKATEEAQGKFPKIKDVLGESTDAYKKNTAPKLVALAGKELGIDISEDTAKELGAEVANEVFAAYANAQLTGAKISNPTEMAQTLARFYIQSGRVSSGFFGGENVRPAADAIISNIIGEEEGPAFDEARALYDQLIANEPEFARMNIIQRDQVLRGILNQEAE